MLSLLYLTLLTLLTTLLVTAKPTLNYAIQDQLPKVARVDGNYTWTLFPDTFTSTSSSSLSYSVSTLPSWLAFDTASLNFYGVPAETDLGTVDVTLTASDGSTTSSAFTILVSSNDSPAVHLGFDTQIEDAQYHNFNTATALPSGQGVLIHPYYSFSMGFQQSTFRPGYDATLDDIYYSAHLRGTTSLPSWLQFDNTTVTFSGVAPASGSYYIVVVGSDYWGYEAVENGFVIEVGEAYIDLSSNAVLGNISTVAGSSVSITLDLSTVDVNGVTGAAAKSLLTVQPNLTDFSWLSYDSSTFLLSGVTPSKYVNGTSSPTYIPIALSATVDGSTASTITYVPVMIYPSLFTTTILPNATATLGSLFSYDLKPYFRNAANIQSLNVSISPTSNYTDWISVDQSTYELSGTPPNQTSSLTRRAHIHRKRKLYRRADAEALVSVTAIDATSGLLSTANLNLQLAGLSSGSIPAATTTAGPTDTATSESITSHKGGLSTGAKIALGVVLGLLGLVLLIVALFFCCFRRRKEQKKDQPVSKVRSRKSADSFVGMVKSPDAESIGFVPSTFAAFGTNPTLPRSESAKLQNGEIPVMQSIYLQQPEHVVTPVRAQIDDPDEPSRMAAMRGILKWGSFDKRNSGESVPGLNYPSPIPGEIIRNDSLLTPGAASDFTHSFGTQTTNSRASWESKDTFQWSSAEGPQSPHNNVNGRPLSSAPSVPRPRENFTPRYPRNAPANRPVSDTFSGHTFSEFHDHARSNDHSLDSLTFTGTGTGTVTTTGTLSTSFASHSHSHSHSGTGTGSSSMSSGGTYDIVQRGPAGHAYGPSALGRIIGDSGHFAAVAEEDEGFDGETDGLAPGAGQRAPRLMPSRERFAAQSPTTMEHTSMLSLTPSEEAIAENSDAFDDADEGPAKDRASTVYAPSDLTGLGYPAEAIVFGDRNSRAFTDHRRVVSMRSIAAKESDIFSPPLPCQSITFSPEASRRPESTVNDGRYIAQTNETFNLHPHINPPPQVSLSASTWSAPPPSTYRIEASDGSALPSWLHWDGKELELWGIPGLGDAGQVISVKVIERIPKEKKKSHDSSQLVPVEATEREVGSCIIEVTESIKSPDAFSLDGFTQSTITQR